METKMKALIFYSDPDIAFGICKHAELCVYECEWDWINGIWGLLPRVASALWDVHTDCWLFVVLQLIFCHI